MNYPKSPPIACFPLNFLLPSPRIYLTSCGCLVCKDCGPSVIKDGKCQICRANKVSAKPIGSSLPPQHLDLFRPLSDQPSLKSITRREQFKTKHIKRGLQLHGKLDKFYKEELNKKEEERKKDKNDERNLEKQVEEKMEKLKLLEEEVRQLEVKAKVDPKVDPKKLGAVAVGGARRKRKEGKNSTKPKGSGSPR